MSAKKSKLTHAQRYEQIHKSCNLARDLLLQISHERSLSAAFRVDALTSADGLSDCIDELAAYLSTTEAKAEA